MVLQFWADGLDKLLCRKLVWCFHMQKAALLRCAEESFGFHTLLRSILYSGLLLMWVDMDSPAILAGGRTGFSNMEMTL